MIKVTQGSVGYSLDFTVLDKDLTGYTIYFKVWLKDRTLKINGECVIDDAVNGTCHYVVQSGDLDTLDVSNIRYVNENGITKKVSEYQAELELTKTGVVENTISDVLRLYESP